MDKWFRDIWSEVIAAGVLAAMTSIISVIQDANPLIIAFVTFAILLIVFRLIYRFQEKKLKVRLNIERERWNKIREERIRLRKPYEDRLEIPSMLLKMQESVWQYTKEQLITNISKKKWKEIAKDGKFLFSKFTIISLLLLPKMQWLAKQPPVFKIIITFLLDVTALLKRHGYGALNIENETEYKELHDKVKQLELGLPDNICEKIESDVVISQVLSSMQIFEPTQPAFKHLKLNPAYTNRYQYLLPTTHMMLSKSRGIIHNSIERWLTGE